jgi:hypothetical protein
MTSYRSLSALALLFVANACGAPPADVGERCTSNADCSAEQTCFSGLCRGVADDAGAGALDAGPARDMGPGFDSGTPAPDAGTPPADTGATPSPDAGDQCAEADCPCESEGDCPYTHYCNRRDGQCAALPDGTCRDDRSCVGRCNIPEGRTVGRCIDCESDNDCAAQAPRTRCLNNTCRLPEGSCENNADCPNGGQCVDGACEGGGGGACDAQSCPPPGQCVQDQCIGGGGGGGGCTDHAECDPAEQCLSVAGMGVCMDRCNASIIGPIMCQISGLACNMATGICE